MKKIQVTLLSGRSLSQGREKEQGKLSESYFKTVACCEINGEDIEEIGLDYGENVRISTKYGTVVVKAIAPKQTLERGIIFAFVQRNIFHIRVCKKRESSDGRSVNKKVIYSKKIEKMVKYQFESRNNQ
jgi:formylmethanofuran dehydrogenase subunit D